MSETVPPRIAPRDLTIAEQANRIAELTKLVAEVTQKNKQLKEENKQLKERIERLEALLASKLDAKSSKKPAFTENYSLARNKLLDLNQPGNKDSDKKPRKKSNGRKPREAKEHLVGGTIAVFPEGVDPDKCIHHHFQSAWGIVDGKAVYSRYDIRDLPGSTSLPLPLGVRNSRSDENVITTKAAANQKPPGEPTSSHVATFILLQQELVDNVDCSFVFDEHPEVEPTNNRSERNARREAEIREGARTIKTDSGAK